MKNARTRHTVTAWRKGDLDRWNVSIDLLARGFMLDYRLIREFNSRNAAIAAGKKYAQKLSLPFVDETEINHR